MESMFGGLFFLFFNFCFCCFYIFLLILSILPFAFWIWMLLDVVNRSDNEFGEYSDNNTKLLWILVTILTGFIGAIVYYFLIYRKYPRK